MVILGFLEKFRSKAKHEEARVRIRRKVVSCIKWPFLEISTLNSELSRPPKRILKAAEQLCEE